MEKQIFDWGKLNRETAESDRYAIFVIRNPHRRCRVHVLEIPAISLCNL